jgi:serine/threonine-protein kinase
VRKALAKDPSARYRSMDAMIADLEAFLGNRPVHARHAGPLYFAWRFAHRWRYALVATATAFVALAATAFVALRQSQVATAEAERANAVASFLVGLFQVSDPSVNRGEKLTANQILDRGAARIDQQMASQPAERARLQSVVGEVYMSLGDFPRARPAFEKALALLRTTSNADSYDLGHVLRLLAWVLHRQDDPSHGLALLGESEAALLRSSDARARNELVDLHNNRGSIKSSLGDTAAARAEFEAALAMAEAAHAGDLKIAGIQNNLGLLLRGFGRNAEALDLLQQALATYRRELGPDHPKTTGTAQNVALVLIELNRLDAAQPLIDAALQRNETLYGENSADYATTLIMRGDLRRRRMRFAEAMSDFERARDIYRDTLGAQNIFIAVASRYIGQTCLDQGNATDATAELQRSLELFRSRDPPDPNEIAITLDLMAEAQIASGNTTDAQLSAEEALPLFRSSFPADHPGLVQNLLHIGLARYANGDHAGARAAWAEALDHAKRAYPPSSPDLDTLRAKIADPDAALRREARSPKVG